MRFHKHSDLEGKHSFLSPSKYAWLRYDDHKLERMFMEHLAHIRGTQEHAFAAQAITLGHRMPEEQKTINMYVNDCIGWRMQARGPAVLVRSVLRHCGCARVRRIQESSSDLGPQDRKEPDQVRSARSSTRLCSVWSTSFRSHGSWTSSFASTRATRSSIFHRGGSHDRIFHAMDRILSGTKLLEEHPRRTAFLKGVTDLPIIDADEYNEDELKHYGILRKSGRYPWGSGGTKGEVSDDLSPDVLRLILESRGSGRAEDDIAKGFDMTTTQLRDTTTIARNAIRRVRTS